MTPTLGQLLRIQETDRISGEHDAECSNMHELEIQIRMKLTLDEDWNRKHTALREAIAALPELEQAIISELTLSEICKDTMLNVLAERLGISAEKVLQLEKKALKMIKKHVLAVYG